MNGLMPDSLNTANKTGAASSTPRAKQLAISQVDNGFIIVDQVNYHSPLQKVALDFDGMVTILKEYFNQNPQ